MDLNTLLGAVNPTAGDLDQLFLALGRVDPGIVRLLVAALDPQVAERVAAWSDAFVSRVNDVHHRIEVGEQGIDGIAPGFDRDFFVMMLRSRYRGRRLTIRDLRTAQNIMTKSLKAANWKEAIWTAITMGRLVAA